MGKRSSPSAVDRANGPANAAERSLMKKTNQAEADASLSGCVDFDRFTAVRRKAPCPVLVSHPDVVLNKCSRGLRIRQMSGGRRQVRRRSHREVRLGQKRLQCSYQMSYQKHVASSEKPCKIRGFCEHCPGTGNNKITLARAGRPFGLFSLRSDKPSGECNPCSGNQRNSCRLFCTRTKPPKPGSFSFSQACSCRNTAPCASIATPCSMSGASLRLSHVSAFSPPLRTESRLFWPRSNCFSIP